ncbi:MAG: NAD-dependent epimerase/dehydratase family protein [Acidimicrobiales bacterium]|nr:NAD-dependent epimerase/dehydratase family protein [Acidimicrobiales bacterium]
MSGVRALLTGGAGLIGSHIAEQLVTQGASRIVIIDDLSRGSRRNLAPVLDAAQLELIEGDIRDRTLVHDLMEGVDVVFHLAAIRITQCAEDPRLAREVLADGSFNVIEAAVDAGVGHIVASSSASVYGMAEVFPTDERHHPYNDDTIYGASKAYLEGLLRSFRAMRGLSYTALRYFNVYGPRMDTHGKYTEVLIRWMERIAAGEAPIIFGDGSQTVDLVHVRDIARANLAAATCGLHEGVYNVGTGVETSLLELARALQRAMGSELPVQFGPERAVNPVRRRLAAVDAARRDLGFATEIDLDAGLRDLVDWWRYEATATGTPAGAAGAA